MPKVASFTQLHHGVYRFAAASGPGAGPHVTILGGVHGNERIGVRVLDALRLALFGVSPLRTSTGTHVFPTLTRGSITLAYGNPAAIRIGMRGSAPHADLNRCFPLSVLSSAAGTEQSQSYEQRRAHELAPILAATDILLDLHSTNKPSEPFVRVAGHPVVPPALLQIAQRLPCSILLHDPKYLLAGGHVALTDEFVGAHGGLGVCFESGVATDVSDAKVERIAASILDVLAHDAQVIAPLAAAKAPAPLETFEITQVFTLTDAGFRWAGGVGDVNFQRVRAHEPIGFVGAAPFAVDYDTHIVFPKVPSLWRIGAPLGWLTRRVPSSSSRSAFV